jgi:hypothetical protein
MNDGDQIDNGTTARGEFRGHVWPRGVSRVDRFAWPVVTVSFGLAQPVLELLGQSPAFFGARNAPDADILITAVLVGLVAPALAGLAGLLPGRPGRSAFFVASGIGLFALGAQIVSTLGSDSDVIWIIGGLVAVSAGTWLFDHRQGVRSTARLLVIAPVLFLALFFLSPTGELMRADAVELSPPVAAAEAVPVVVVVLDEFPLASMLGDDGEIRSDWFPNFARLADDALWFRNAATTQELTEYAVPAILTGRNPSLEQSPIVADHPDNLLTILRDDYYVHAIEALTSLCPSSCIDVIEPPTVTARWQTLANDLVVAAGHRFLPPAVASSLPSIEDAWADYGAIRFEDEIVSDRGDIVSDFSGAIATGNYADETPDLFFMHVLLPHRPWQHLPDGRILADSATEPPGSIRGTWSDPWAAALGAQRYLMEAQFTDRMLGDVTAAMAQAGIYDDALLVVVADHGVAIDTDPTRLRTMSDENVGAIGAIPMFFKLPAGERSGEISDYRALGIDVLPTMADVLGFDLPSSVEGTSLLRTDLPERSETVTVGPKGQTTWSSSGDEKYEVAKWYRSLFPAGDVLSLVHPGDSPLLGRHSSDGEPCDSCRLDEPELFGDVDPNAGVVPAVVKGSVDGHLGVGHRLGVVVNGRIAAVTYTFTDALGNLRFEAVIDPASLVGGANEVEILDLVD